jgi:hypothetical protein
VSRRNHDRFRELCRQVIDEDANGWQKALPVGIGDGIEMVSLKNAFHLRRDLGKL